MKHSKRWLVIILISLALISLVACSEGVEITKIEPAKVEPIEGTEFNHVTLTEKAAQRLGIESVPLSEESVDGSMKMVTPYAALLYGLNGETWVYVRNPGPDSLTFVREPVTVDYIEGDMVVLLDGPAVGTEVVIVGVAELFGTDTGVGK